jgi:hypothetical protein
VRSALYAEAERRGTTPSRVLEALLVRHLAGFIADAIQQTLRDGGAAGHELDQAPDRNERPTSQTRTVSEELEVA